jgi:hypothetical protein
LKEDVMSYSGLKITSLIAVLVIAGLLAGCGGTKVLKEPQPMQVTQPLAAVSNSQVAATLDWVIVRDGPGTWAKNADWDEYLLRIQNLSDEPLKVTRIVVVDSLDTPVTPMPGRKELVKASKKTARRYKDSGIKVKAGRGAGTMLVAGAAVTVVGVGAASAAATGAIMSGAATAGGAGVAAGGLLLLGPAVVVGGIVRGVRNSAVNEQIEQRQTKLPFTISTSEELALDIFFPLAPSPRMIEVTYVGSNGEERVAVDTEAALRGLHID